MADAPKNVSARDFLGPVAERLNRSSDLLNDSLAKIQADLRALNLGLEAWVPIPGTRYEDPESEEFDFEEAELGFAEHEGEWVLMVRSVQEIDGARFALGEPGRHYENVQPLLRASRQLRIESVSAFGALLAALRAEAERVLQVVEAAEAFAGELRR